MIQLTALRLTFSPCPNREAVAQRRTSTQARHGVLYAVWLLMPSNQFLPQFDRCFVRICKKPEAARRFLRSEAKPGTGVLSEGALSLSSETRDDTIGKEPHRLLRQLMINVAPFEPAYYLFHIKNLPVHYMTLFKIGTVQRKLIGRPGCPHYWLRHTRCRVAIRSSSSAVPFVRIANWTTIRIKEFVWIIATNPARLECST